MTLLLRDYRESRRQGWGLRQRPKLMPWSHQKIGSVDYDACCVVLQERPLIPLWLARVRGWFDGMDCGGTSKLRRYVAAAWLWKEDDETRRDGFWNRRHGAEIPGTPHYKGYFWRRPIK